MLLLRPPVILIALGLAASAGACTLKDDTKPAADIPPPADVAAPPANAIKTDSGIASKVIQVGLGSIRPTVKSMVRVHYVGWTADGRMFDSSMKHGGPLNFTVGEVIPGWTEILQLMVIGEKRRVWIPGRLAYDNDPNPNSPKGQLCFEIELIDILG